jgi:hypothetical protein
MTGEQKTPGQIAYEACNDDQLNRMYPWENSQKKHMWEASAAAVRAPLLKHIADLQEELRKRGERIAKLEERLEIDHVYTANSNNEDEYELVRVEVSPEDRDHQIDGISARDSTISLLEDRIRELSGISG